MYNTHCIKSYQPTEVLGPDEACGAVADRFHNHLMLATHFTLNAGAKASSTLPGTPF